MASKAVESTLQEHVEAGAVVSAYTDMVERCARNLLRELALPADVVDLRDLIQFGYVGLLEARARFDPSRGGDFRWYAHARIQGAILDGLRKMTRLPRRTHHLLRVAGVAQDDDLLLGGGLAAALDVGSVFSRAGFVIIHSPYPTEPTPEQPSPEQLTHEKRRGERIRRLVDELVEPEREVARRRLIEGESLASIASGLGISRPWAWRVLERACCHLTGAIGNDPC